MISKYRQIIPLLLIFLIMATGCGADLSPAPGTSSTTSSNTADTTAPTFAGLKKLSVLSTTSVELSWSAATDNSTPSGQIRYNIYMADSSAGKEYSDPPIVTEPGVTSGTIDALTQGETYYFLVRAEDASGNEDLNEVEKAVAMVEWLDPAGTPTYINKNAVAAKAADEPSLAFNGGKVYAAWVEQDGSGNAQTYVKYWDGTSWTVGAGLNENISKSSKEATVAFKVSDTAPYAAWSEHTWSGSTIIGGDVYMKKWNSGTNAWELLGGNLRDTGYSIATIGHSPNVIPDTPHIAFIQRDTNGVEQLFVKRWNGATWDLLAGSNPSGSLNESLEQSAGLPVLAYLDTIPYVAWVEGSDGAESEGDLYVKRWDVATSSWEPVGGKLNSGNTHHHPWITSDGNTVYVSWAEENTSGKSQAYVAKWNETKAEWEKLGGSLNIDSSKDANHARVAMSDSASGSIPYAAWVEKNSAGVNQLYVRHWDGNTWVLDGGSLNVDPTNRGVTEPHLVVNGNVPYVAWVEVGGGLWPVYVKYLP